MPEDRTIIVDELVIEGYQNQPLYEIRISDDNRKWFSMETLTELAGSMQSVGVLQPILVRPVAMTTLRPQRFEVVAGERRFRAAIIAQLPAVPLIVKWLSDEQAAEIRLLENIQREDPHPLEEADGFQQLMLTFGYDVKKLMDITKKSEAYVYASLKLCALTPKARELFMQDKEALPASTALLIARIPVPELQNRALAEILSPGSSDGPMSFRAAKSWIQGRYMLNLKKATFPIKDAKLLAGAGSCNACPKRAGNQPQVFIGVSADVCTDPDCFAEKTSAHKANDEKRQASTEAQARKAGIPIHEGAMALAHYNKIYVASGDVVCDGTALYTFARVSPHTKMEGNVATYLRADDMPTPVSYIKEEKGLMALYSRIEVQAALEAADACLVASASASLETADVEQTTDATPEAADNCETEHAGNPLVPPPPSRADRAKAETARRVEHYRIIRARASQHGTPLQLLREIAKLMVRDSDNSYTLPDDLIPDVYSFSTFSDDGVCQFIDHASMTDVHLILMDLTISQQLSAGLYEDFGHEENLAENALRAMDAAMPDAPAAQTPRKTITLENKPATKVTTNHAGPLITTKKTRVVPEAAWPFPTQR